MLEFSRLSYSKLQPQETARSKAKLTNEQRFWKKLTTQVFTQYNSPISCISCNANVKNLMAVGHGISVTILNPESKKIVKQMNSITDTVSAVCIRNDGAVMAYGDEVGKIQIMDTQSKFNLRTFKNHTKKVNALEYIANYLYSGSDDMTIRMFDVSIGKVIHSYENAHDDYIKSLKSLNDGHLLSAGYDNQIKLFDFRVHETPQMRFDHGYAVEAIDVFSSKMSFVGCGGKKVSLWDIRSTKPLIQSNTSKKLLSCVKVGHESSRIFTTSFDQHLKIYRSDTLQVTYQQKCSSPITCFDITSNESFIGMGTESGTLLMKGRSKEIPENEQNSGESEDQGEGGMLSWLKQNQTKEVALNKKYFYRGVYGKPTSYDIQFERNASKKISIYDRFLKAFKYGKALLVSLKNNNYLIFQALIEQYIQRGSLQRTIKSLSEQQVQQILPFLSRLIHNIKYSRTAIMVLKIILENHVKQNVNWSQLNEEISKQIEEIELLWELDGMLEVVEYSYPE